MSTQTKLTVLLYSTTDINKIYKILKICDILHNGGQVEGFTQNDLPPDDVYEAFKQKYNYVSIFDNHTSLLQSDDQKTTLLYMSTIPKDKEIVEIKNALVIPKYDGVSVAVKFIFNKEDNGVIEYLINCANTRGKIIASSIVTTDITAQLQLLINKFMISKLVINAMKIFKIETIVLRGELILNYKQLDSKTGETLNKPAAEVAGLVNGDIPNFKKKIDKLCLQFYEIGYIDCITNDNKHIRYVPTQLEAIQILKNCKVEYLYNNPAIYVENPLTALDTPIYKVSTTKNLNMIELYSNLLEKLPYPIDGLVYCAETWKYPQQLDEFNKKGYGKHAWKPSSVHFTYVEDVKWQMTKSGELNPIVIFKEFVYSSSKYSSSKVSIGQLCDFIKRGFGKGAEINVEIVHAIIAHINDIVHPVEKGNEYQIPLICPFCNSKLILEDGKTKNTKHLKCNNNNCIEQKIQKYAFLIQTIYKINKDMEFRNKEGKIVKSAISEKKLREIYANHQKLDIETLKYYIPNLIKCLDSLKHEDQLFALSFGGMTQIKKIIKEKNSKSWKEYNIEWFN